MCGIVGCYGFQDSVHVVMDGLKKLEYRGYDSAGVAIFHQGRLKRVRTEGPLSVLEEKLRGQDFDGHLGMGHTRWATHGPATERNAHPHCVGGVSIVHNGILENYMELREKLKPLGVEFQSDTDSELIAHLIHQKMVEGMGFLEGSMEGVRNLTGAYSLLVLSESHPEELVAFKNGPPLIVGICEGAIVVASDILPIVSHTKKVLYLKDNEVVYMKQGEIYLYNHLEEELPVQTKFLEWSESQIEKKGYSHFMLKEIYEQPVSVFEAMKPHIDLQAKTLELGDTDDIFKSLERIFILGCGTSYYAAMMGEYIIENFVEIPVEVDIASEFRYRHTVIPPSSLVILISQSGETADTLATLELIKDAGARSLSICNVQHSTLDRESQNQLYMNAGVEVGVASTKALTCTVVLLNLLALYMAKVRGRLSREKEKEYVQNLLEIPYQMETVLAYDSFFSQAANTLKRYKGFLYMGRGIHYPVAMEGALKLKELAYMHAEGYAAGEMKHGPLALIDRDIAVVALVPKDSLYEKTVSNLEEVKARGGTNYFHRYGD